MLLALPGGLGISAAVAEVLRNSFYNFSIHSIFIPIATNFQDYPANLGTNYDYKVPPVRFSTPPAGAHPAGRRGQACPAPPRVVAES
jgi:hypothetical protein